MSPIYKHTCKRCVFLGYHKGHDLYACKMHSAQYRYLIERHGDGFKDSTSVMIGSLLERGSDIFQEAYRLYLRDLRRSGDPLAGPVVVGDAIGDALERLNG